MTELFIGSNSGIPLEGRWDAPHQPDQAVVFCHPHPLQGGTMTAPLMSNVTAALLDAGIAVLRFNFRGVGSSGGVHDHGLAEQDDVAAAVAEATREYPQLPLAVAGWSFGAATALRWQARDGSRLTYAGIAPPVQRNDEPVLPPPGDLLPAARTFIIGDRDQFTTVKALEEYARTIGASVSVITGSDHFFHFREERVADLILGSLHQ